MQAADTHPGADQAVALKRVASLMHKYSKYILRDPEGKPLPTIVDIIISYSIHYCLQYPTATVSDSGQAIGAAEQKSVSESNPI